MMKNIFSSVVVMVSLVLFSGCGQGTGSKADAGRLEEAFKTADAATRDAVAKSVSEIKAANYAGAFSELLKLNGSTSLTAEQRKAVQDALHDLAQLLPPKPVVAPGMPAPPTSPK